MRHKFKATLNLVMENSFGILDKEDKVEVEVIIGIGEWNGWERESGKGWFEVYDINTGGEKWHMEGGLWFKQGALVDYDGCGSLPECIEEKLKELNYKINLIIMEENNELIAEFMGVEKENGLYLFTTPMDDYKTDTLYFDVSWDWLMPVVSKCYEYGELDNDYREGIIETFSGIINIEDTYKTVVEFIKFFNQNK